VVGVASLISLPELLSESCTRTSSRCQSSEAFRDHSNSSGDFEDRVCGVQVEAGVRKSLMNDSRGGWELREKEGHSDVKDYFLPG
jgi:hypothetical protein